MIYAIGAFSFLLGFVIAASSITITTELFSLMPATNKSLAAAINLTMLSVGMALSGLISVKIIDLKLLHESWELFGLTLSHYDTLILGCAVMIVMLVVTLGLVPSVLAKKPTVQGDTLI